jgi:integrating conjugative element protein (TIGR03758 family)
MAMDSAQSIAFKAASGNIDANVLHLVCIGLLLSVLFLWAGWALVDIWNGWSNGKVTHATLGKYVIRFVGLLIACIWMFAS